MSLISWIENSALGEWVRVSTWGYPIMITLHSLGLAIMVGLSVVLSLRVLGLFAVIPYDSLRRLLRIAWLGFLVNFLSGSCLFANSATRFIVDWLFILKMTMVIVGAMLVGIMQMKIKTAVSAGGGEAAGVGLKVIAWATIAAWAVGMVAGRFIAYPH
jgi:hypothetical protein